MSLLSVDQLVKSYGTFSLGPLQLNIEPGTSVALIGANGAGKTTFFRSVMGTLRTQQGEVRFNGATANASNPGWKQEVGYVGDFTPLFENWTGHRNLKSFARFYQNWSQSAAEELAQRLGLDLDLKPKQYSTGQRTKMGIVLALAHKPQLLLLDEPGNGLDPVSRDVFIELLFEFLQDENHALVYATHHISEVEQLADRLVFVSEGQVVRDEIKEDLAEKWRRLSFRSEHPIEDIPNLVSAQRQAPYYELVTDNATATLERLQAVGIEEIESSRLSIEKIAVEILKSSAREINHV